MKTWTITALFMMALIPFARGEFTKPTDAQIAAVVAEPETIDDLLDGANVDQAIDVITQVFAEIDKQDKNDKEAQAIVAFVVARAIGSFSNPAALASGLLASVSADWKTTIAAAVVTASSDEAVVAAVTTPETQEAVDNPSSVLGATLSSAISDSTSYSSDRLGAGITFSASSDNILPPPPQTQLEEANVAAGYQGQGG